MGREIRRVPSDWVHPVAERCKHRPTCEMCLQPLFDQDYQTAAEEWIADFELWRKDGRKPTEYARYYWEEYPPPDPSMYRSRRWTKNEATHYQMYETVSEGTPVTPVFATRDELVEYLVTHGTSWDHGKGWDRSAAVRMVRDEYALSLIIVHNPGQPPTIAGPDAQTDELLR